MDFDDVLSCHPFLFTGNRWPAWHLFFLSLTHHFLVKTFRCTKGSHGIFCQNCSDLLREKIILVIEKNFWYFMLKAENLQNFWDHEDNLFKQWKVRTNFGNKMLFWLVPGGFIIQNGKNLFGFKNMQEKVVKSFFYYLNRFSRNLAEINEEFWSGSKITKLIFFLTFL